MKWYLVEMVEMTKDQKAVLVAARVPLVELKIAKPRVISGVAFPEEEKPRVLEMLGLSSSPLEETPTDQDGVWLLSRKLPAATVTVASWEGKNQSGFVKVALDVLGQLGRNIVLHVPHQSRAAPKRDGQFHIWFWSSPVGVADQPVPATMWGIPVDCRDNGYAPSGQGIPIIEEAGWAVGELVEFDNLYIHHDLCHKGTDHELSIFRYLLEEVAAELSASPEKEAERQRKLAEASKKAYVRECERRLENSIAATRAAIEKGEKEIRDAQQRITELVRSCSGFQKKLEQLENSKAELEQSFALEFDKLEAIPGVKKVGVRNGLISIFTDEVDIEYNGKVYNVGAFRIDIYTNGSNGGVRCFNLTRTVDGYCHPHIKENGECCLGNIAAGVAKLIGEYQYSVLAELMLRFIHSVNPSGWYISIERWPMKEVG